MNRLRDDRGTVLIMVTLLFTVFILIVALTFDFGRWYQAQRNLQAAADAAVLAGAQDLPDTATASSTATSYANSNASGLNSWSPSFPDTSTIDIRLSKDVQGPFSKISKTVHAHARAVVGSPGGLTNVAPVVVNQNLACRTGSNCFGPTHTVVLDFDGTPGSGAGAGLVDLNGGSPSSTSCSGGANTTQMQGWIAPPPPQGGYSGTLSVNQWYGTPPGVKNGVQTALQQAATGGWTLLFPVFDTGSPSACGGAGGFHVIGWSAFVIQTLIHWNNGQGHQLQGYFVTYIPHNVVITPGVPGFGVKAIQLAQ